MNCTSCAKRFLPGGYFCRAGAPGKPRILDRKQTALLPKGACLVRRSPRKRGTAAVARGRQSGDVLAGGRCGAAAGGLHGAAAHLRCGGRGSRAGAASVAGRLANNTAPRTAEKPRLLVGGLAGRAPLGGGVGGVGWGHPYRLATSLDRRLQADAGLNRLSAC